MHDDADIEELAPWAIRNFGSKAPEETDRRAGAHLANDEVAGAYGCLLATTLRNRCGPLLPKLLTSAHPFANAPAQGLTINPRKRGLQISKIYSHGQKDIINWTKKAGMIPLKRL